MRENTGDLRISRQPRERRNIRTTLLTRQLATRREGAARRHGCKIRRCAGNGNQPVAGGGPGDTRPHEARG